MRPKKNQISFNFTNGTYTGRVNSQNRPHGRGKMEYTDGSVFHGFFCNGFKHGNGKLVYPSGNKYSGQFHNDTRTGYGEFYYSGSDECYIGYWKNNKRDGRGEYRFKDGSIFRGVFKNDLKHGVGKKMSRNMEYTGVWEKGMKNGLFKFKHLLTGKESMVKYVYDKRVQIKTLKAKPLKCSQLRNSPKQRVDSNKRISNSKPNLTNKILKPDPKNQNLSDFNSPRCSKRFSIENQSKWEDDTLRLFNDNHAIKTESQKSIKKVKMGSLHEIIEVPENKVLCVNQDKKILFNSSFDKITPKSQKNDHELNFMDYNADCNNQRGMNFIYFRKPKLTI